MTIFTDKKTNEQIVDEIKQTSNEMKQTSNEIKQTLILLNELDISKIFFVNEKKES